MILYYGEFKQRFKSNMAGDSIYIGRHIQTIQSQRISLMVRHFAKAFSNMDHRSIGFTVNPQGCSNQK